jgi:aminoglycoside N3'-acetyltransferase
VTSAAPSSAPARPAATRESLRQDLEQLGLGPGDVALVRADVGEIGRVKGGTGDSLIGALRDAVGPEGTLVALAFTRTQFLWRVDRSAAFNEKTPPTTGALAKLFLEQPDAVRSRHPTNSFVAIGARAAEMMAGHDETTSSFEPMGKIVAAAGKQVLIGCTGSSPGFTTVHWAQHTLGLDRRSILAGWFGAPYEKDGAVRVFQRHDIGGCSMGFGKLYAEYAREGLLHTGPVGKAESMLVEAAPAYALEHRLLSAHPRAVFCDDRLCPFCRGSWLYNKREMPGFYARYAAHLLTKALRKPKP